MLFGENGNGKSTIADGIVCLCTNEHGSLDDKSSIDKAFYFALDCKPEDVQISLSTDAGIFTAKASKTGTFIKTPDSGHPMVRHLRRSQIMQLIEEQPSKRYEKLQSYIDVNNIAKSEDTLRKAKKEADQELKLVTDILKNATAVLTQAWNNEGRPMNSWEDWAKTESAKDVSTESSRHAALQDVLDSWATVNDIRLQLTKNEEAFTTATAALAEVDKKLREAMEKDSNANLDLLTLLQQAKKFISERDPITACPVCNSSIEKNAVVQSLTNKISTMEVIKKISEGVRSARQEASGKEQVLAAAKKMLHEKVMVFERKTAAIKEAPYTVIATKLSFLNSPITDEEKLSAFLSVFDEITPLLDAQAPIVQKIKTAIDQHNLIKTQYNSISTSGIRLARCKQLCLHMELALDIVEKARKQFIQDELTAISSEVNSLYEKIHPKEELGGISLTLKQSAKNSLELNADFHNKKSITPQSIYSESHLDTLGICVFIALAKRYGASNSILILDDVVMSVDENHLDRFIALLHDECDNFAHILITTHYRPWRDRYRYNRAPGANVHFVELRAWSLQGGIKIQNGRLAIDELRLAMNDTNYFDRQKITSSAGVILENLLDFLSVLYGCKLQRKPKNDYQLRELLDSISRKLLGALKVQHFSKDATGKYVQTSVTKETELKEIIEKIKALAIIRNWVGAHFNYDGSLVSDKDVEAFGNLTLELAELLTCPETGQFPDRKNSGSYWETKTGSIRLHPLQEPS